MAKLDYFTTKNDNKYANMDYKDDDVPIEMNPKVYNEYSAELMNPYVRLERIPYSVEQATRIKNEIEKREGVRVIFNVEYLTSIFSNEKILKSYVLLERLSPDDIQHLLKKKDELN